MLYNLWLVPRWVKFDQLVHVYGAAVGTWVCWQGLRSAVELRRPGTGPVALCVFAGMGLGALNETAEYLTTRIVSDTNVGGFENTGWDLVSNLIGATVAGFAIRAAGVGGSITPKTFS